MDDRWCDDRLADWERAEDMRMEENRNGVKFVAIVIGITFGFFVLIGLINAVVD